MLKQTLSILLAFACLTNFSSATTFFVKQDGTGSGSSWFDAVDNLQSALDHAKFGDEIWVAEGTYFPVTCSVCTDADRAVSFNIPDGVKLLGGFAGNENRQQQRDWRKHPTTLSGNIGRADLFDNSYTVVFTENVSENTIIDGFIISHGNADAQVEPGQPGRSGAGWYNEGSGYGNRSNPFVMNCVFLENQALEGAGMFNNGDGGEANPTLASCVFTKNKVAYGGGAVFNNGRTGSSVPSFDNCQFVNNEAAFGAGIFNACPEDDTEPTIDQCTFVNNKAQRGSGLFYLGLSYEPALRTNRFLNNQSTKGEDVFVMKGRVIPEEFMASVRTVGFKL